MSDGKHDLKTGTEVPQMRKETRVLRNERDGLCLQQMRNSLHGCLD